MSVRVWIGEDSSELADVTAQWLHHEVDRRRDSASSVRGKVEIHEPGIELVLPIGAVSGGGGGGRPLTPQEAEIVERFKKFDLARDDFKVGQLVAFVSQLRSLLR